jgi:hypothetical protein
MEKAVREAKIHASWMNPSEEYEKAIREFICDLFDNKSAEFVADLSRFVAQIADAGYVNSLVQLVLKATLPGVPDCVEPLGPLPARARSNPSWGEWHCPPIRELPHETTASVRRGAQVLAAAQRLPPTRVEDSPPLSIDLTAGIRGECKRFLVRASASEQVIAAILGVHNLHPCFDQLCNFRRVELKFLRGFQSIGQSRDFACPIGNLLQRIQGPGRRVGEFLLASDVAPVLTRGAGLDLQVKHPPDRDRIVLGGLNALAGRRLELQAALSGAQSAELIDQSVWKRVRCNAHSAALFTGQDSRWSRAYHPRW